MTVIAWKSVVKMTVVAAFLGLAGCDEDPDDGVGTQVSTPTAVVAEVTLREIRDTQRFIGRVEPMDTVDLQARVEGYLERRNAGDGKTVVEGETLFTIEPAPYEADLARARAAVSEAEAALELAEIELERKKLLLTRGTISQSEYDVAAAQRAAAAARLDAAMASADQAEIRLGYTEIKAPFDGRLGRISRSEGDVVGPGSGALANLTRMSPIFVAFAIAERDLVTLIEMISDADGKVDTSKAPTVNVRLPNGHMLPESGTLAFLDNRVDPASGTIAVRARFENKSGVLVPGVFVNVEVGDAEPQSRPVIPQAALQQDQQGKFVLVVGDDGLVEQRYVSLGQPIGTEIAVTQGVEIGENVIVEGLQRVRLGQPVETVPAARPIDDASGPPAEEPRETTGD